MVRLLPACRLLVLALLGCSIACGAGSTPGPTPVGPPTIACPADVVSRGVTGGGQDISYAAPATSGGSQPVRVDCTPVSGSLFPLGATVVTCTARDAASRSASCTFSVTLSAPLLGTLKLVAFGDSVTEGQNGLPERPFRVVDVPNSYPTKLQALFDLEYPGQGILVLNRGEGREQLEDAVKRLPRVLADDKPDALLLLEGYNDLAPCGPGRADTDECTLAMQVVINKLRECIQIAQDPRYVVKYIFVGTLTPPGPFTGSTDRRRAAEAIIEVNRRIAQMVPAERAILVDSYASFAGHEAEYVSEDGLHLRPAGNEAVARAFLSAIKQAIPATMLRSFLQ